ncbi:hypothetical protein [Antribacter gilvus]|uniref:hypothetical protein n=1 Tax=Antribacter gilvus TaxID=2304675 RepID=UPI000F79F14A|nr:hypothetical protein [Antribacter gilvus]
MSPSDPLAGLDDVGWRWLSHAYGSAADVPGLLRDLQSREPEVRERSLSVLSNAVVHQGSRCSASAPTARFVVELVLSGENDERAGLVGFLVHLAIGLDYELLPDGVPIARWRADAATLNADLPSILEHHRRWAEQDDISQEERELWERNPYAGLRGSPDDIAVYDVVQDALPRLVPLLDAEDAAVRGRTAYLVGWFPESAPTTAAHVVRMLERETDQDAVAQALITLSLVAPPEQVAEHADRHLRSAMPRARWGAANALARCAVLAGAPPHQTVVDELFEWTGHPEVPELLVHYGDVAMHAATSLRTIARWLSPDELARLPGLPRFVDDPWASG